MVTNDYRAVYSFVKSSGRLMTVLHSWDSGVRVRPAVHMALAVVSPPLRTLEVIASYGVERKKLWTHVEHCCPHCLGIERIGVCRRRAPQPVF